jgi:hypothetical protein
MLRFVFICLMVAAMTSCLVAQSTKTSKPNAAALALAVRTDRHTYRMSDIIQMETRILNTGNEDVYIWDWDFCWNPARGLSRHVTTPDGTPVQGSFLFDCVPPPPVKGNVYAFIKLEPQQFHGVADEIKVTDIVSQPGEYDIQVTYNSFLSSSFIQKFLSRDPISNLPVWTMEQPTITAPSIRIVISR